MNFSSSAIPALSIATPISHFSWEEPLPTEPTSVDEAKPNGVLSSAVADNYNSKRTDDQEIFLRLRRMKRRLFLSLVEADETNTKNDKTSRSTPFALQNNREGIHTKVSMHNSTKPSKKMKPSERTLEQANATHAPAGVKYSPRKENAYSVREVQHSLPGHKRSEDLQHIPELELGQTFDADSPRYLPIKAKSDCSYFLKNKTNISSRVKGKYNTDLSATSTSKASSSFVRNEKENKSFTPTDTAA